MQFSIHPTWAHVMAQKRNASPSPQSETKKRHKPLLRSERANFEHIPLEEADSFRLLKILPGQDATPIRCFIYHTSLSDAADEYTALSYVWGPPLPARRILLNGKQFEVRENLYNFLVTRRQSKLEHDLWIDALCIDQKNLRERNHQVGMMQRIFSSATGVVAWLGLSNVPFDGYFHENALDAKVDVSNTGDTASPRSHFLLNDAQESAVLAELAMRPYWNRLWVVQELLLAQNVTFWIGRHCFTLSELCGMMKRSTWVRLDFMKQLLTDAEHGCRSRNLAELVDDYGSLQCQDPRDSVYALLGIAHADSNSSSTIDVIYEESYMAFFSRALGVCDHKWPLLFADNLATILGLYTDRPTATSMERSQGSLSMFFRCCGKRPSRYPSKDNWEKAFSGKVHTYRFEIDDEPVAKTYLAYFRTEGLSADDIFFDLGPHSQNSAVSHVVSTSLSESDNLGLSTIEFGLAQLQADIKGLEERHMKELDEFAAFIKADCTCEIFRHPKTGQRYLKATTKVEDLVRFLLDSGIAYKRAAERLSSKRDIGEGKLRGYFDR